MPLLQQDIDIVSAHPLDWDDLDRVRGKLRHDADNAKVIASLLISLVGTEAAFHVRFGVDGQFGGQTVGCL